MKLFWLGFSSLLSEMHEHGFTENKLVDLPNARALDWQEVCAEAGFVPDVLVYADSSLPPPLVGLERFPCVTCFYAIDTHIHSWYPLWARAFDCAAVSLRDHLADFEREMGAQRTMWLPPYPRSWHIPKWEEEKKWDVLFAGKVDPELTPERQRFLSELQELLPGAVHVTQGSFRDIFPQARIVLNVAERGDLNLRVFEALACGSCLLTPDVGHGQDELFTPGEYFEVYENLNAEDAAGKITALLADPQRCEALARAGHALIEKAHRTHHRAISLAELLNSDHVAEARAARLQRTTQDKAVRAVYLHWAEELPDSELRRKYLEAALG